MNGLTEVQVMLVVVVAGLAVQAIKVVWIGLFKQPKPSQGAVRVLAVGVSAALAYFWRSPVALPDPAADPWAFAQALLTAASGIAVVAGLIYDYALDKILTGLDTALVERLFKRRILSP